MYSPAASLTVEALEVLSAILLHASLELGFTLSVASVTENFRLTISFPPLQKTKLPNSCTLVIEHLFMLFAQDLCPAVRHMTIYTMLQSKYYPFCILWTIGTP